MVVEGFFCLDILLHLGYMLLSMQRSKVRLGAARVPLKNTSEEQLLATVSHLRKLCAFQPEYDFPVILLPSCITTEYKDFYI